MNADQLLEHYTAEIDKTICDFGAAAAQRLLDAGASVDDLPRLMKPIVQRLAQWRAALMAKIEEDLAQTRANEMRIQAIEAQIERLEGTATVH